MFKIKVKYKVWQIVQNAFNGDKYRVIWYNVTPDRIIYMCQQTDKAERVYLTGVELEWTREYVLWFDTK